MLVEQDDAVGAFQPFEQEGAFAFLYLVGRGVAEVFEGRDDFDVEVYVVAQALAVDVDAFLQVGGVGLGDDEEFDVNGGVWSVPVARGVGSRRGVWGLFFDCFFQEWAQQG